MTSDELRRACERAGLTFYMRDDIDPSFQLKDKIGNGWWWYADDPALPAYVASVLVGMVRGRGYEAAYHVRLCDFRISGIDHIEYWASATDTQRIRAAMAVLEADDGS